MSAARSELALRVWSGVVMAALAVGTLWIGGVVFDVFWTLIAVWIFAEWATLAGCQTHGLRIGMTAIAFAAAAYAVVTDNLGLAYLAILAGAAAQLVPSARVSERFWAAGGVLYAAVIVLALLLLRHDDGLGIAAVAWMFAVVWSSDIAAYFTGRRIGGPKLMPSVSPKKTWSGFIGGTLAGTLAGSLVGLAAARQGQAPLALSTIVWLSCLASMAGQAGDLAESAMKRRAGAKDSGHLIPGHGGVMDRLDAFWAVALIALVALTVRAVLASSGA